MSTQNSNPPPAPRGSSLRLVILFPIIAVAAVLFANAFLRQASHAGLAPGKEAPAIAAAGWLNGDPLAVADFAGKVVVVDAWFAACPHCSREAPELVRAYERFHDKGVVFVGLTPDEENDLASCRRFLKDNGITWPNGFGASETLGKFLTDGPYFPAIWVIGANGKVLWNRDSAGNLEEAIAEALAAK